MSRDYSDGKPVRHYVPGYGETVEEAANTNAPHWWNIPHDAKSAAEFVAGWVHSYRDGWEATWPLEIAVEWEDEWHTFSVEREYEPTFTASKARGEA